MWMAVSLIAVLGIIATVAYLWMFICKRKEIARLLAEHEKVSAELEKALEAEPENLQLHLRLRASLRDVDRVLTKCRGD